MTIAGLNGSEILSFIRDHLPSIEEVCAVYRGVPTTLEPALQFPSIWVYYQGSDWRTQASRHYTREGLFIFTIITAGRDYQEAEDSMFLIQDRVKAWLRANESMQRPSGERYGQRALVLGDGPIETVNDETSKLRCEMRVSIHWTERFTSEVNSASRGVIGPQNPT